MLRHPSLRRLFLGGLLLAVLPLFPAALASFFHPQRPSWDAKAPVKGEVWLAAVQSWQPATVLWIDARAKAAYDKERIPGALLLNEDDWDNLLEKVLEAWDPDLRLVVYCDARTCQPGREVAKRLREQVGLEEVYFLKGGWQAWQRARR